MNKYLLTISLSAVLAGLFSCSEDFDVAAPYKDITFVYGMLDMRDTAHYIRIQKAFLDEQRSAIDMAKQPDSSFYKEGDLDVVVREIAGNSVITSVPLSRVDMTAEGYPKQPGQFFTGPNYAYKFKHVLRGDRRYRLVLNNNVTGEVDSAEIDVVDSAKIVVNQFNSSQYRLSFARTIPMTNYQYNVQAGFGPEVRYTEGIIRFKWVEKKSNGETVPKSADLKFVSKPINVSGTQSIHLLSYPHYSIYTFLKTVMGEAPGSEVRYLDSCDIFIWGAGEDFYEYMRVSELQGGGLTADQIKPLYTNIKGKDVYGLLSSRSFLQRLKVPIDSVTFDSLRANPLTSPLKIQGFWEE